MDNKITVKTQVLFGFYQFCVVLAVTIPMMYIAPFMTENLGMSAALMGTVLLVARSVDFILGLISGPVVEKSRMKWGTYRSWLVILRWTVLIGACMQFFQTSSLPMGLRAAVVIIGYILMHGSMNFVALSQYGLVERFAGCDMIGRSKLTISYARGMTIANILISAIALPSILFIETKLPGYGYLIAAAFFVLFFVLGASVMVKASKEVDRVLTEEEASVIPKITIGQMVKTAATNGQLMLVLLAFCLAYIGMFLVQTVMAYYWIYIVGNYAMMALSLTVNMILAFVGSIVGPIFGQKTSKKAAAVVGMLFWAITAALVTFFAKGSPIAYMVLGGLGQIGFYTFFSFGVNYFLDAGEYKFYQTGIDNRNVSMAMFNMPMKIGMALGGAIAGYGLEIVGYSPTMMEVSESFVNGYMFLTGIVPAIFIGVAGLLMLFFWKISDSDAAMYAKANAERIAAQKSGAEGSCDTIDGVTAAPEQPGV